MLRDKVSLKDMEALYCIAEETVFCKVRGGGREVMEIWTLFLDDQMHSKDDSETLWSLLGLRKVSDSEMADLG